MKYVTRSELRPITRITKPLKRFLHIEAASGIVLLIATAIAIAMANSSYLDSYTKLWNIKLTLGLGGAALSYPLWYWVNDGLMTVFFFLVGLEIKREIVAGELREVKRIVAPAAAAFGGALVPAIIYLAFLGENPGQQAWAIPMATDIAFVVGAITILGKRVPHGLKVFLLTLAIVDDIIAVLVIAIFYTSQISLIWLFSALIGVIVVIFMNRIGVRNVFGYLIIGALTWLCTLKSGIHPTISGVMLGLLTPAIPLLSKDELQAELTQALDVIKGMSSGVDKVKLKSAMEDTDFATRESISPLERLEADVHPWAAFVIMPIFALANAGVPFSFNAISSPIAIAIAIALLIGKPLGIVLSLVLVVKTRLAAIPDGSNWGAVIGAGCLAGIGFTMSLFVASLSLTGELLVDAKAGILVGSTLAIIAGTVILMLSLKRKQ